MKPQTNHVYRTHAKLYKEVARTPVTPEKSGPYRPFDTNYHLKPSNDSKNLVGGPNYTLSQYHRVARFHSRAHVSRQRTPARSNSSFARTILASSCSCSSRCSTSAWIEVLWDHCPVRSENWSHDATFASLAAAKSAAAAARRLAFRSARSALSPWRVSADSTATAVPLHRPEGILPRWAWTCGDPWVRRPRARACACMSSSSASYGGDAHTRAVGDELSGCEEDEVAANEVVGPAAPLQCTCKYLSSLRSGLMRAAAAWAHCLDFCCRGESVP